jgi:LEA14-like dessication related protein
MKKAAALVLAMAVVLPVLGRVSTAQRTDLEIKPGGQRVKDLSFDGLTLVYQLDVANLSAAPQYLVRYDYQAIIEGVEFIALQTDLDEPIRLEPKSTTPIALPVKITYAYLFETVPAAEAKDLTTCYLAGGLTFHDERKREKRLPVSVSAEFPICRKLEIRLLPVEVKDLTVGGADVILKAAVGNPNGFVVTFERLAYKFDLVGKTISSGTTGRGQRVDGHGETVFTFPVLLDFYETGRDVYDGLTQPPVAARIEAAVDFATPWGVLSISLAKSDKIPIRN